CRHNLLYWQGHDYLGLGPSAQSYIDGCRFGNVEGLSIYHRRLASGQLPVEESVRLTPKQRLREAIVFGLRLIEGVDLGMLRSLDKQDDDRQRGCERLICQGLLEERSGRIRLTEAGRRFADSVAVELF
ncbi:MAG: coproporphyrinogen III oxidase, partial [Nitrospiraceae bacterium]